MKDRLNLWLQRAHLQATNMRGAAIEEGSNKARWHYEGKREAIEETLAEVNKPEPVKPAKADKPRFSHNDEDTIYHEASPTSLRFAFLVVSEFFDTPSEGVTKTLQFICDKLNEEEAI